MLSANGATCPARPLSLPPAPATQTATGGRVAAPEHSCALITLWLSGEIAGKRLKHGPDEDGESVCGQNGLGFAVRKERNI